MAILAFGLQGHLGRTLASVSRATAILIVVTAIGAAIALWARMRIDGLLSVEDGAMIDVSVADIEGDCGTPSIYLVPQNAGDGSRYHVLVDFLGGANRFAALGGRQTVAVLALPASRPPGVGLGRGLLQSCDAMTVALAGDFSGVSSDATFPDIGVVPAEGAITMQAGSSGLALTYRRATDPAENQALATFLLGAIADRWQHGSKRVAFTNSGNRDVNVFFHEEDQYQFVNEVDALVRPVGTRRAYADVHLAPVGDAADNTVVVYRRRPTADIELQHELIGISTVFGIGVSLLIEGLLLLVVALAGSRPRNGAGPAA